MLRDAISVKLVVKGQNVRRELEEAVSSVEGFCLQRSADPAHAELLIFEIGSDLQREFQLIHSLQNFDTAGEVFLTSHHSDPSVLVQAIRAGAKEFFSQPIRTEEVTQALERFKERRGKSKGQAHNKKGRIIHVMGAKGGVGTTTIAVNLADSLAKDGRLPSVVLIDMNLLFGEIPLFLDIEPTYHWSEIAKDISRLDTTFLMSILSKHSSGLYLLPSASQLNGHNGVTPEITERLLRLMQTIFDFIVIDGGQHLDDISLKIFEMSDTVLLISVLSLPCLANVNRLLGSLHGLGHDLEKSKVVINRYLKNPEISLKDAEDGIKKRIFRTIPNDYRATMSAINHGKPVCEMTPRKPIAKDIRELATALLHEPSEDKKPTERRGTLP
ncbi:MAG: AAA family ATPase [Proteobacteria bacterium]|nr:AAA family ATPase [Pseudomonadota bacterium]